MTAKSPQSTYEKWTATGLFLLVAVLGWLPFMISASRVSNLERGFLFVSLAIGFLALTLVYDVAERFLAAGRGIYTAAIFCSLPATGWLMADPGYLPVTMLLLLVAAASWFAVRAAGEQRTFLLAMLAGVLTIAGFGFFTFPAALAFIFPVWLATYRSSRRTLVGMAFVAAYGIGMILRQFGGLQLPMLNVPALPFDVSAIAAVMPWRLYAPLTILFLIFVPRMVMSWHIAAISALLLTTVAGISSGLSLPILAAVLAPVNALLAGDLALQSFESNLPRRQRLLFALPPLLTVLLIAVILFVLPIPGTARIVAGVVLGALLLFTSLRRLPRWSFALLFAAGIWFGSFLWPQSILVSGHPESAPTHMWWILLPVAAAIGLAGFFYYYGRSIPRRLLGDGGFRFAGEDFRRFDLTKDWEGKGVAIAGDAPDSFSFIIFGDVTGAESPIAGRHGGYYAFRRLMERIRENTPQFAISLGDLATQATALSFRRVRQLLRHVPVPLTAIPGNHDLFRGTYYDGRNFQSLFGADHHAFRCGAVQFVLINNASGAFEQTQFDWLERTLKDSDAPYLLVFCHKPLFDPRPDSEYVMETRDHADHLHELFRAHQVTAVFSGHIHTLLAEPRDGVTYVISGGGGSRMTTATDVHHYLLVTANTDTLRIEALPVEAEEGRNAAPLLKLEFSPRPCSSVAQA